MDEEGEEKMSEYDKSIHSNPSGDAWAKLFMEHYKEVNIVDVDFMRGWFANAMMAMHDHLYNTKLRQLEKENGEMVLALNKIAYHPHNTEEKNIDIQDGHRCAAQIARDCLNQIIKAGTGGE